jgi:hypothetical protein
VTADLLDGARGLTLMQPWCHAITDCGKRTENRRWHAPKATGTLLIHAGKSIDPAAGPVFARLGFVLPALPVLGAIVAVATLSGVCTATVDTPWASCGCGPWAAAGQYHWKLADVRVLADPVPCKGQLGLWIPDRDVLAAVRGQLAAEVAS